MKSLMKRLLALAGVAALSLSAVHAQDSGALLDALVKKGILTDQESEDIRAQLVKDFAATPAGKFAISSHITQLKLYGDGRLRFEYQKNRNQGNVGNGGAANTTAVNDRERYRIRVGAEYSFTDHFLAGFELESATAADSANQSFGNGFSKSGINVGLIYLKYKAADWLTLTAGKFKNPLYTTDLVWDPDVNPEGGAEEFLFNPTDEFSVGLTAAQLIYANRNESGSNAIAGGAGESKNDVFIFAQQIPLTYKFSKDINAKFVPGLEIWTGGSTATANGFGLATDTFGSGSQGTYSNYNGGNHLQLVTLPGEVNLKAFGQPIKPYWDFSYNLDGKARVQDAYLLTAAGADSTLKPQNAGLGDNIAWLAGVQVGQNKKKGDWSVKADYRQIGLGSVDPNINDSDFANSSLNQQGVKASATYNVTDFLTVGVTYFNTWAYKEQLFANQAGAIASGIPGNNLAKTERVQADIVWKF